MRHQESGACSGYGPRVSFATALVVGSLTLMLNVCLAGGGEQLDIEQFKRVEWPIVAKMLRARQYEALIEKYTLGEYYQGNKSPNCRIGNSCYLGYKPISAFAERLKKRMGEFWKPSTFARPSFMGLSRIHASICRSEDSVYGDDAALPVIRVQARPMTTLQDDDSLTFVMDRGKWRIVVLTVRGGS